MKKKKENRWQKEQKQRKTHQTVKIVKKVSIIIFLILFLGSIWRLWAVFKHSQWDGRHRLNLLLQVRPISLVSFDPDSQTINFLVIPDGTFIEAADGYGPYRVEKIYALGELEGRGRELLAKSLEVYFGLPVDGWLVADKNWTEDEARNLITFLIKEALLQKEKSNLSFWDLGRLWLMANRTRGHKIEVINLAETTVAEGFTLPDGSQAKKVDEQRVSRIINRLFADEIIRQENLAIGVMNASGQTGLGAQAEKLITNVGGRLVEVGDWPEEMSGCWLRTTSSAKGSYTSQKLAKIFHCQIKPELGGGERWDLQMILGKEAW
jgi:hypothetical protein